MAEPTNTPVPASTPRSSSPIPGISPSSTWTSLPILTSTPLSPTYSSGSKPRVLHIGDPVKYSQEAYDSFSAQFDIIRPSTPERQRPEFLQALKEKRWGDFQAVFRPHWGSGGEMGLWDEELVRELPGSVKVFASAGAGFDWADTKVLGERGIIYCNSGLAAAEAVADFAIAMIISTFRHLPWCITAVNDPTSFSTAHTDAPGQSHNLRDHTIGLIGFGNIGQRIAQRCYHGFGIKVHYYDVAKISDAVIFGLDATGHDTLESLIKTSDCAVLATPAIPPSSSSSKHIITSSVLSHFRKGGRFVNIARGSLVDESALADALQNGTLSSVALDVHANEPHVDERLKEFARQGKALLTCHNAGGTVETHAGFEELSMRNVVNVLKGGKGVTPVNLQYLRE